MRINQIKTDVLIVGGGGAAARAAIEACDSGAKVLMALKGAMGRSGATTYSNCEIAGYNVPTGSKDPMDNPDEFYSDIITAGMGMADPALASILAEHAAGSFNDLRQWGVTFENEKDRYLVMRGCFSSRPRGHIIKGHGGPIMAALAEQIRLRSSITVMENTTVIDLVIKNGACAGAAALTCEGEVLFLSAKAVVLAAGGASQVFLKNLNPPDVTGDSYAMAHRAGAKLVNMEFMQAGIGFSYPVESLFNTYLWAGMPQVVNAAGEPFLGKNLPEGLTESDIVREHCRHFPFSSRDISRYVELAVQREIAEGRGTARDGVLVSFSHFTPDYVDGIQDDSSLRELWPTVLEYFNAHGVDLLHESIEIACYAQAINGGVKIDENAMSTIPGLFAAGEACGGPHGADRLGGNMLMTCQVFGRVAGSGAAAFAKAQRYWASDAEHAMQQISGMLEILKKKIPVSALDKKIKKSAQSNLMISRSEKNLLQLLDDVRAAEAEIEKAPYSGILDLRNLMILNELSCARLMGQAALLRKESRGSHYRVDFPDADESNFSSPIIL